MLAAAPMAYVVTQAARWVDDLTEGRSQMQLAASGSRLRLVLEWATGTTAGMLIVAAAAIAGCFIGSTLSGTQLTADILVRTGAMTALGGLAVTAVALVAALLARSGLAIGVLVGWLGASFLLSAFGAAVGWPGWLVRLSIFDAGTWLIALLVIGGAVAAASIAQRRSVA